MRAGCARLDARWTNGGQSVEAIREKPSKEPPRYKSLYSGFWLHAWRCRGSVPQRAQVQWMVNSEVYAFRTCGKWTDEPLLVHHFRQGKFSTAAFTLGVADRSAFVQWLESACGAWCTGAVGTC